jgi:hypothetical protein
LWRNSDFGVKMISGTNHAASAGAAVETNSATSSRFATCIFVFSGARLRVRSIRAELCSGPTPHNHASNALSEPLAHIMISPDAMNWSMICAPLTKSPNLAFPKHQSSDPAIA